MNKTSLRQILVSYGIGFFAALFILTAITLLAFSRHDPASQTAVARGQSKNTAPPEKSETPAPVPVKENKESPPKQAPKEESEPPEEPSPFILPTALSQTDDESETDSSDFVLPIAVTHSSPEPVETPKPEPPPTTMGEPKPAAKPVTVAAVPKPVAPPSSPPFNFKVETGHQEILYPSGKNGIHGLPISQVGFISTRPRVRVLMGVGGQGMLMEGKDLWSLQALRPVLTMQTKDVYCCGGSVVRDPKNKNRLLAFAFVNDCRAAAKNQYAVVSVAESFDDGNSFSKLLPIISSRHPNKPNEPRSFGSNFPCVILDKSRQYYYLYYTDLSESAFRGEQACMARCSVRHDGAPGKWFKYHEGKFQEPGLGGMDTPLINLPHVSSRYCSVQYIKSIDRYVMAYVASFPGEWSKPISGPDWKSGIYISISEDGISWSPGQRVFAAAYLASGEASVNTPTLVPIQMTPKGFHGYVLYAYSERWGDEPPNIPFSLAGRKISLTLTDD